MRLVVARNKTEKSLIGRYFQGRKLKSEEVLANPRGQSEGGKMMGRTAYWAERDFTYARDVIG